MPTALRGSVLATHEQPTIKQQLRQESMTSNEATSIQTESWQTGDTAMGLESQLVVEQSQAPAKTFDVSVAIRAYNSAETLPAILDNLKSQVDTDAIQWEIVVVDNNSTDATAQIVQRYQADWNRPYPLKYFLETHQGASFARKRAIAESQGTLIAFLDDDNIPDTKWISAIHTFEQQYPQAGVFGSQIHGDFEVPPPKDFRKIQGFLAIKEYGTLPRKFNADLLDLPAGAGMVVRKHVWLETVPNKLQLKGPVANSLTSKGEDFESMIHIRGAGWEIWYNPEMCIHHKVPAWRLEEEYLQELVRCSGLNICTLRFSRAAIWQKPLIATRIILGSTHKALKHFWEYKGNFDNNIVARCQMTFYLSCLMSPFTHIVRQLKK